MDKAAEIPDGLTRLQYLLAMLDAGLTGKKWADVLHTARNASKKTADVEELLFGSDRMYYLSDGGYSRVVVSIDDDHHLFLTSNSTDRVKGNWENCKELIQDVQDEINRLLQTGS